MIERGQDFGFFVQWDLVEASVGIQICEKGSIMNVAQQIFNRWQDVTLAEHAAVQLGEVSINTNIIV